MPTLPERGVIRDALHVCSLGAFWKFPGKWTVLSLLLLGAIPGLTGLLVHDALRGPLPPAEETAALTWGKIWALGLVCVKVWAR